MFLTKIQKLKHPMLVNKWVAANVSIYSLIYLIHHSFGCYWIALTMKETFFFMACDFSKQLTQKKEKLLAKLIELFCQE